MNENEPSDRSILVRMMTTCLVLSLAVRDVRAVRAFALDAPKASVHAVRADVSRSGATITVRPKSP